MDGVLIWAIVQTLMTVVVLWIAYWRDVRHGMEREVLLDRLMARTYQEFHTGRMQKEEQKIIGKKKVISLEDDLKKYENEEQQRREHEFFGADLGLG